MHVATTTQAEIRLTIETMLEVVNGLDRPETDTRSVLVAAGFSRASEASEASLGRLESRLGDVAPLLDSLPDLTTGDATRRINEERTELPIAPSIADHNGAGPHMHWTPNTARFDDQVLADLFMALAQELCDNGTDRFDFSISAAQKTAPAV